MSCCHPQECNEWGNHNSAYWTACCSTLEAALSTGANIHRSLQRTDSKLTVVKCETQEYLWWTPACYESWFCLNHLSCWLARWCQFSSRPSRCNPANNSSITLHLWQRLWRNWIINQLMKIISALTEPDRPLSCSWKLPSPQSHVLYQMPLNAISNNLGSFGITILINPMNTGLTVLLPKYFTSQATQCIIGKYSIRVHTESRKANFILVS
jgi:hypothetical protein